MNDKKPVRKPVKKPAAKKPVRKLVKKPVRKRLPPLSGSEIPFTYEPWRTKGIRSNNCYAYAVNDYETYRYSKSVPGERTKKVWPYHDYTHCKGLSKRVIADNPRKVYKVKAETRCRPGFYKIMMVVAPSNKYGNSTGDFHFYKQHGMVDHTLTQGQTLKQVAEKYNVPYSRILKAANGRKPVKGMKLKFKVNMWSHKMGWATGPLIRDAKKKIIKDPRTASRKYGYNYSKYCCSMCVKNRGINVGKADTNVAKN
jgi:LysM repeat protein